MGRDATHHGHGRVEVKVVQDVQDAEVGWVQVRDGRDVDLAPPKKCPEMNCLFSFLIQSCSKLMKERAKQAEEHKTMTRRTKVGLTGSDHAN